VDRLCVAAAATVACSAERPCSAPWSCSAAGVCVLLAPCAGDGGCPAALPHCSPADGRCLSCLADAHCAATQRCAAGRCQGLGACAQDEDCPGTRTCDAEGFCQPAAGCDGDRFDGERLPPRLEGRSYTDLLLCDGDQDVYRVALPAGESLRVALLHRPEDGDLALALGGLGGPGLPELLSDGPWGAEALGVAPSDGRRTIDITVHGRPGRSVPYVLSVERDPGAGCPEDGLRGPWGDDTQDGPARLQPGLHPVWVCPDEEAWATLSLRAGTRVHATLQPLLGTPEPLRAQLQDPEGAAVAQGSDDEQAGTHRLLHDTTRSGLHRLGVRVLEAPGPVLVGLDLGVEAGPDPVGTACAAATELPVGDELSLPGTLPVAGVAPACGDPGLPSEVLRFELEEPAWVTLRELLPAAALPVALRRTCEDPDTELVCGPGALDDLLLEAGEWFVVVATPPDAPVTQLGLTGLPTTCAGPADCPAEHLCTLAGCRPRCAADGDCHGAQTCAAASGQCQEPDPCRGDGDCLGLRVCEAAGCLLPDCGSHADCGGGDACVDRSCGAPLEGECVDDGGCLPPRVCAASGACVLPGPCAADAQCTATRPHCSFADGVCAQCRQDADCAASEQCLSGRCRYAGGCVGDADCRGSRTCVEGACVAQACTGDRFDGLATPALLRPRSYTGLVLCDGAQDRYRVHVPAGEGLRVRLYTEPAQRELSLVLRDLTPGGGVLAQADGGLAVQELSVGAMAELQDLELTVAGAPGSAASYALDLSPVAADECVPDGLEGPLDNDVPGRAVPLTGGTFGHRLCPGDEDWFRLTLPAGAHLGLYLETEGAPQPPVLELYAPQAAEPLAEGEAGPGGRRQLETTLQESGRYLVRITAPDAAGAVPATLRVEPSPAPDALQVACAAPTPLAHDATTPLPAPIGVELFENTCAPGQSGQHIGRLDLQSPSVVRFTLSGARFGANLSLRSVCSEPGTELLCAAEDDPALQTLELAAGTWYVFVTSFQEEWLELGVSVAAQR